MRTGIFGTVISAFALCASGARADDVTALYQVDWAGLPAARLRLTLHEGPDGYRDEIRIGSEGFPKLLTHFRGAAVAAGKLTQSPVPVRYDADYDLRKRRDRKVRMGFTAQGAALVANRGPGDTSRKAELAEQFRRNVLDPLTSLTLIRAALRRGETAFTIPVYDGARRFDVIVRVLPRDPAAPGIRLALSLRPIAGFKGETSEDGDPDDGPRPLSLTLSDDGRLLPLWMSVPVWFLPLTATLERVCAAAAPCDG
jgi:hypothetical protein